MVGVTHRFVLLVKIVDISVEDLDKKLDRGGRLHTRVCHAESALEALEDALTVTVELVFYVSILESWKHEGLGGAHLCLLRLPVRGDRRRPP